MKDDMDLRPDIRHNGLGLLAPYAQDTPGHAREDRSTSTSAVINVIMIYIYGLSIRAINYGQTRKHFSIDPRRVSSGIRFVPVTKQICGERCDNG